jgi:hypothetical protein
MSRIIFKIIDRLFFKPSLGSVYDILNKMFNISILLWILLLFAVLGKYFQSPVVNSRSKCVIDL